MDILEDNDNFTLSEDVNGPALSVFVALIMVTGFLANLFVIIITFCHPQSLKQPSTIFLTSLLLADLVVVVFVMPFTIISGASGGWKFGQSVEEKHRVCQFVGFMFWYGVLLALVTLATLSFDRFLSIVKPFVHKQYMKLHTALVIIVIAWITCAILDTTPFYGFGRFAYFRNEGTCIPDFSIREPFYLAFILIICVTLVAVIMITSIWTCCFTRRFLQEHQPDNNIYISKDRRVIGIFGSLLLVCALAFGPGILTATIRFGVIIPYTLLISIVCFYCITIANPLVQSFFRPDVRETVKYIFDKCSLCRSTPSDAVESQQTTKTYSNAISNIKSK